MVGAYQNDLYHLLVMEQCRGVTLFQLVELNTFLPESVARVISKQVTRQVSRTAACNNVQVFAAIAHLHSLAIVHGDIKGRL